MRSHLVACPRRFPHAEHVARAYAATGSLTAYVTGFVTPRWLPAARLPIPGWVRAALAARRLDGLPSDRIRSLPWVDVGRALLGRAGLPGGADLAWEADDHLFARWVVRRGFVDGADVIHAFEHSALEPFRAARDQGRRTVLHAASLHPRALDGLLAEARARAPDLDAGHGLGLYEERRPRRLARCLEEIDLADLIVANSRFCARSFVDQGVDPRRVLSVPMGGPRAPSATEPAPAREGALQVLFAGTLNLRKGIHLLLAAWRSLPPGARLLLAGSLSVAPHLLRVPGVEWLGPVPHATLLGLMERSDLLVLPSLADGYGVTVAEALSRGTPVLTTTHVGAADLIIEARNGWVVPAGDEEALAARLRWAQLHVGQLRAMRAVCRESVAEHTWEHFQARLRAALDAAGA